MYTISYCNLCNVIKLCSLPADLIIAVCLYSNCITILSMAGVVRGDDSVCLQCDCQYEARNTLVIKVRCLYVFVIGTCFANQ